MRSAIAAALALVMLAGTARSGREERRPSVTGPSHSQTLEARIMRGFPLPIVENRGQLASPAMFFIPEAQPGVRFHRDGIEWSVGPSGTERTVRQVFVGVRPDLAPEPFAPTGARFSWFKGPRAEWRTGLPAYQGVRYRDAWPGIDVVFTAEPGQLKYAFHVAPGADIGRIAWEYQGADGLSVGDDGSLRVACGASALKDSAPTLDQEGGAVRYSLSEGRNGEVPRCALSINGHDPTRPVVIDPSVEVAYGVFGPSGSVSGVALDGLGRLYVAGTANADALVASIAADGSALRFIAYFGGAYDDAATGLAVDTTGNCYVAGQTRSPQNTFPVIAGPDLTYNGLGDGFIAKLSSDGTSLAYCGYLGGTAADECLGIAVDGSGRAYVTGDTISGEASFPVVGGPDLTANGFFDAFVARVAADGSGLEYCGFLGGSNNEQGLAVAVDASNRAVVAGETYGDNFPLAGGLSQSEGGGLEGFVCRVAADGASLVNSGYLGGDGDDSVTGIALDSAGNAYLCGTTKSTGASLPLAVGPDLVYVPGDGAPNEGGGGLLDVFVAKVRVSDFGLDYCGYIAGSHSERAQGIAVDAAGNAYVVGWTLSDPVSEWAGDKAFPVVVGPSLRFQGSPATNSPDGFIAKVRPDGSGFDYCGYLGSGGDARVAAASDGSVWVAGSPSSSFGCALPHPSVLPFNSGGGLGLARLREVPGDSPSQDPLVLALKSGTMAKSTKPGKDRIVAVGSVAFGTQAVCLNGQSFYPPGSTVTVGLDGLPLTVALPAWGPGWKYHSGGTFVWHGTIAGFSKAKVVFRPGKIVVSLAKGTLPSAAAGPAILGVTDGSWYGTCHATWEQSKPGKFRVVPLGQ